MTETELWEVEAIVGHRKRKNHLVYLTKWKGFPKCTLEPRASFTFGSQVNSRLLEYEQKYGIKSGAGRTKHKSNKVLYTGRSTTKCTPNLKANLRKAHSNLCKTVMRYLEGRKAVAGFKFKVPTASLQSHVCCVKTQRILQGPKRASEPPIAIGVLVAKSSLGVSEYGNDILFAGDGQFDETSGLPVAHQELEDSNRALLGAMVNNAAVHVLHVLSSMTSLRYGGSYNVRDCWHQLVPGNEGQSILVWRYHLQAVGSPMQSAAPQRDRSRPSMDCRRVLVSLCINPRQRVILGTLGIHILDNLNDVRACLEVLLSAQEPARVKKLSKGKKPATMNFKRANLFPRGKIPSTTEHPWATYMQAAVICSDAVSCMAPVCGPLPDTLDDHHIFINGVQADLMPHLRPFLMCNNDDDNVTNLLLIPFSGRSLTKDFSCGEEEFEIPVINPEDHLLPNMVYSRMPLEIGDDNKSDTHIVKWNPDDEYDWESVQKDIRRGPGQVKFVDPYDNKGRLHHWWLESYFDAAIQKDRLVVSHGLKKKVALYWAGRELQWGVKTLDSIQKGEFVMTYVGEVITDCEVEKRGSLSGSGGNKVMTTHVLPRTDEVHTFVRHVDAQYLGNIASFLNHSCEPNLVRVDIYNFDQPMPMFALFANCNIPAGEVLTMSYHWYDSTKGPGTVPCHCRSKECLGWLR